MGEGRLSNERGAGKHRVHTTGVRVLFLIRRQVSHLFALSFHSFIPSFSAPREEGFTPSSLQHKRRGHGGVPIDVTGTDKWAFLSNFQFTTRRCVCTTSLNVLDSKSTPNKQKPRERNHGSENCLPLVYLVVVILSNVFSPPSPCFSIMTLKRNLRRVKYLTNKPSNISGTVSTIDRLCCFSRYRFELNSCCSKFNTTYYGFWVGHKTQAPYKRHPFSPLRPCHHA